MNQECCNNDCNQGRTCPNHKPFDDAKMAKIFDFFVEMCASVLTIGGLYLGSTTKAGAILYMISLIFWYTLTIRKKAWGLMPLNVASTFVTSLNLWKVWT